MLIKHLPFDAALVTALNDGVPAWTSTDHLLADLWELTVKVHTDGKRKEVTHPVRAELSARAKAKAKKALRALFLQRKNRYQGGD